MNLPGNLSVKNFLKLSIYSCGCIPFCFNYFNKSPQSSCDKYLEALSEKFLTNISKLEFANSMLSIKIEFLLIVKAIK